MELRIILAIIVFVISVAGLLFSGNLLLEFLDDKLQDHQE